MSNYSKNINLELPTEPERYNIGVFNKNNMVIDSELHKLDLKDKSQDELLATKESLNSEISRAVAKENDIERDLDSEIARAKSAENENADGLLNEINRAITAEETINQIIETKAEQTELDNYLPVTGGIISNRIKTVLSVNNSSDDTNGVEIKFSKEGRGLISLIGEKDGIFRVWSFLESRLLLSCGWNEFLYKGKKVLVHGEALTVNDGTPMPLTVLNNAGNYVGIILDNVSPVFGESKIRMVSESANEEKRFLIQEISGDIKTLLQLSEKNRKIYDAGSNALKKILVEGEALSATGGTLSKDGRDIITFNNLGQRDGIQGSDIVLHFNNQGAEYSQIVMRKTDDGVMFMIWDTLSATKDIFHVTQKEITYKGKKILVEGSSLPATGGTIESSAFPMLKLKSVGGNKIAAFDLIPEQDKEIKLRVQSGYDAGKDNASFDFFEINDGDVQQLCTLTKNGCKVFDPVTNTLKRIIVEGETLPITGGKIADNKRNVLYLNNTAENASDVEIIFQVNNVDKMALSGRDNGGIGVYDFVNKQTLLEATNSMFRYKGKNVLVEDCNIDNCKVNGKKVAELLGSAGSNAGIIYSDSEPSTLHTGMTWIGN